MKSKILKSYMEFQLLNGRKPISVLELTKKAKLAESSFFKEFSSLEVLDSAVLLEMFESTVNRLASDADYDEFSAREKLLAVFYTLFEVLLDDRSYLTYRYKSVKSVPENMHDWKRFLQSLTDFCQPIFQEGIDREELKDRPYFSSHYGKGVNLMFTYLFRVWLMDDSQAFATTDAAIEKTVNTSFDLLGSSPLDSLIDLGKFAFSTKVI